MLSMPQPAQPFAAGPILVLADDLTGACDSVVPFVASRRAVRVVLGTEGAAGTTLDPHAITAFTTETRELPNHLQAAERVTTLASSLRGVPGALLFKKVDSAARGHFGAEIVAALDNSGAALALVAPAFPQAGRTVYAGVLNVRDAAAQNTSITLRDLFPQLDDASIDKLPTGSAAVLERGIAAAISRGVRILLCDAATQADLEHLALAASRITQPILWTGSAGLARALATTVPISQTSSPIHPDPQDGRTRLFIGTDHPVTTLQLAYVHDHPPSHSHTTHLVDWTSVLPEQIRSLVTAAPSVALVLTGGETAAYILRALDASSILLAGEVAPGIPWGTLEGGVADGCVVVTKSGGFGPHHALADIIRFCDQFCIRSIHVTS
jgi:uncharacterized protein YgbK (DUF1537 family)